MDQSCQEVFDELCRLVLELRLYGEMFSDVCEMSKGIAGHSKFHFEPSWRQGHEGWLREVGIDRLSRSTFAASLWLAAPHIARFEAETIGAWGKRVEGMIFVAISSRQEVLVPIFKNFLLLCAYVNCMGIRMGAGCGGDIVEQCKSLIHLRKALEERGLIMPEQPPFEASSPACATAINAVSQERLNRWTRRNRISCH